ncbi:MAG: hypothetical protein MMC33_001278 [Icmadophila ericetorum]|nr:hypothetical protein [Icmadophila ericetorum]
MASPTPTHYNAVIIGSGQGGTPLAQALAKAGRKTALIESSHIGGCCINEGCTPTKTLIASGKVAYHMRRGADYGINVSGGKDRKVVTDMERVRQRKRDIVESWRAGGEKRTRDAGVEVLWGEGSFKSEKSMVVRLRDGQEKRITADSFFVNTGERPAKPKLPGIEDVPQDRKLDSTSVQELGEVPSHLIVLGGGYIGLEFGQLFRRLGAEVTIIQRSSQLLPREDPDIAASMLKILSEDGLTVHLSTNASSVSWDEKHASTGIHLQIRSNSGKEMEVVGSHLLSAAGRTPNTDMLNLSSAGVETNSKGYIEVNERLETSAPGIWAIGDVKGPPAFTHISYDDFRIVQANVLNPTRCYLSTKNRTVPYVCFTDPQMAHVGFHEAEVRQKWPDRKIKVAKMPMNYVARALEMDESRGLMKVVVDAETSEILGFSCLGIEGGEIMSIVQMAMMGNVHYEVLKDAVWAHPSLAESLNNLWGYLE